MWSLIAIFSVLTLLLTGLLAIVRVKDSAGRVNNVLLMHYLAIAIWAVTCIGSIVSDLQRPPFQKSTSIRKRVRSLTPLSGSKHHNTVLWGLIIISITYVLRRPEWARMIIDAIRAWSKQKSDNYVKEMLAQHAIFNPEDRYWVERFVKILDGQSSSSHNKRESVNETEYEEH